MTVDSHAYCQTIRAVPDVLFQTLISTEPAGARREAGR